MAAATHHELLELLGRAALTALFGTQRGEVELVLDHFGDVRRCTSLGQRVKHRLDVGAQRTRRQEAVRADVAMREMAFFTHFLDLVIRATRRYEYMARVPRSMKRSIALFLGRLRKRPRTSEK